MQEVGHFLAAFPKQVKLSIPFFIPHITLGSFGAITQVRLYNFSSQSQSRVCIINVQIEPSAVTFNRLFFAIIHETC